MPGGPVSVNSNAPAAHTEFPFNHRNPPFSSPEENVDESRRLRANSRRGGPPPPLKAKRMTWLSNVTATRRAPTRWPVFMARHMCSLVLPRLDWRIVLMPHFINVNRSSRSVRSTRAELVKLLSGEVGFHVGEDDAAESVGGCAQVAPGGQVGRT